MDAEDHIRALRRDTESKRRTANAKLIAAAAQSVDPAVRAAWAELAVIESFLTELSRKKEE